MSVARWLARDRRPVALLIAATATAATALPLFSADLRPDYRPAAYAITGAKVVVEPGREIESGTVVVRNGRIEAVGKADEVTVPYDAETIDGKGLVVYPGFLDLYTSLGQGSATRSRTGPGRAIPYGDFALPRTPTDNRNGLTPEFEVASALDLPDSTANDRRKLGFTDLLSAPAGAIATGQSALVSTAGLPRREAVVRSPIGLHVNLRAPFEPSPTPSPDETPNASRRRPTSTGSTGGYPMALMGVIAHLRQAMLDAGHRKEMLAYQAEHPNGAGIEPIPFDPALDALGEALAGEVPIWWEANTRDEILRVLDLAEEFGTRTVIVGGREAGEVAGRLKAAGVPVVLRLDFPDEPKVPSEADYAKQTAEERESPRKVLADRKDRWTERVATARDLAKAGVRFAFASDGLSKAETFHEKVRKTIAQGLTPDQAVAALTRDAAEVAGLADRLGTIAPGKLGHLVVLTAPYGDEAARVRYVLADGLKFEIAPPKGEADKGKDKGKGKDGEPDTSKAKGGRRGASPGDEAKPKDEDTPKDEPKTKPAPPAGQPLIAPEAEQPKPGESTKPAEPPKEGESTKEDPAKPAGSRPDPEGRIAQTGTPAPKAKGEEDQAPSTPLIDVATEFDEDRKARTQTGGNVLIKDATILTVGPKGTIPRGSILIRDGKIAEVGPDLEAPEGLKVIEAAGLVAMPGIIDTHSHMAIQGGVNEMSLSIVPEVRVKDVVTGDDPTIYRALAGGTTAARLLHGSANTIGGQDAVIKLRYGQGGRDLIIRDGSQGVKFALGENVTRRTGRFPNTRMGVEATLERAFAEGAAYRAMWDKYDADKAGPPPRRDLRLEALAGVLDGSIRVHSHCYRSDEILMLLRLAERHGVRVRSLQHVLEGYKVAAEIAAHGASASTFSDWWAYKVEAYDAIPYNAALLDEAGAEVCIKSDDEELVRHLYLEAAKMVRYGDVSEAKALEMITLNPAKQLGLDHRLGSIEVGKDADVALFNAHPFDGFARCELALIDGEVWFERRSPDGKHEPRPGDHAAMPTAPADVRARDLEIPIAASGTYALVGATLHPVSGPDVPNGTLIVADGKIAALGGPETAVPPGAETVDCRGLDAWPGLIDSGSILGLFEIGSLSETHDYADSAPYQPELRTSSALHPDSELIPVTRANGILNAYIQPTGGTISGQGCLIDLDGWVPSEMVVVDGLALDLTMPRHPPASPDASESRGRSGGSSSSDADQQRKDRTEAIKEHFRRALAYDKVVAEAKARNEPGPIPDPRMAALVPFAKGDRPVIFHADRRAEILDALKLAEELKVKAILSGGSDAWKVADAIKKAGVPVLIGGVLRLPTETSDPYDAPYANPAKLLEAGIPFAIRASAGGGAGSATAARNLPFDAAMAVAYGLPEAEALKAVTLAPARLLGVADALGSLEPGKRANLVLTAGHVLQPTSMVKALFIAGKPLPPESRHTRLFAKYRGRLAEIRAGKAPLGLEARPATASTPSESTPDTARSGSPSPAPSGGTESRR